MFSTAFRFLAAILATFALLTFMWVSAAHAAPGSHDSRARCTAVGDGITMCDGAGYRLPDAPRGTVRRLPRVSTHRVNSVVGTSTIGARVGVTVVVVRMGARG